MKKPEVPRYSEIIEYVAIRQKEGGRALDVKREAEELLEKHISATEFASWWDFKRPETNSG